MDAESILKGLNSDQRAAVLHDHEKNAQLLILAGAGSGKTSVLTKRIQYRIMCGVNPEKILALTFTAKAAAEMRERVQALFPEAGVRLCTFHSLALHMLKCKVPSKCEKEIPTFAGESSRGSVGGVGDARPAYELLGFKNIPSPTESADRELLKKLSAIKVKAGGIVGAAATTGRILRENLFADGYSAAVLEQLKPLREQVLETGQVVFEDLIYLAIYLLENFEGARVFFREQWQEILVDEYQDINPTQYRLVKLGDRRQLFVVGDDDQAIYGFRGADIGNINRFCDDFKESTLIRLEWNYRSVPNILHLANEIFENKPIHLRKVLRAGNPNGSGGNPLFKENRKPEIWVSDNPVEEMQKIVLSVKELSLGYGLQWKNFAILVRYNRQRLYYEQALRDYKIPVAGDSLGGDDSGEDLVENGIHVETVHASKGLQYAVVYYAGLAEKLTPGECLGNRAERKKQLDEERRLYYVGVTRAEACLFLLYCKRRFWKGKLCKLKRSRFLPKEKPQSEFRMPLIVFKVYVATVVLAYMFAHIVTLPITKLRYGKNFDAWLDKKIQAFSRLCMKALRIDLSIEDQAQLGKIDWNRPVFVVGNHNSFADIPIVFLAIERTVGFVAKKSLSMIPFLNFWMHKIGCILVDRQKGGAAKAVRRAIEERGSGVRLFIFPEGTRSKTGKLGPFKSGAFRFACENEGFVLPLVIKGSGAVWERRKDSHRCKVSVKVLEPVDVAALRKENPQLDPKTDLLSLVQHRMEAEL